MKVYQRGTLCPHCGAEDVIADREGWQCVSCGRGSTDVQTFAKHQVPDTEDVRRLLAEARNAGQVELAEYIQGGGQTWSTAQLREDFEVQGFAAPYVVVVRKSDYTRGTLRFTHSPRYYFDWREDTT